MKLTGTALLLLTLLGFISCSDDDSTITEITVNTPDNYSFTREGESTVSFSGQSTRILMGQELGSSLKDFSTTADHLLELYKNENEAGGDANPFQNPDLNVSDKSIKSKVAASVDYFGANSAGASIIKQDFETWINGQVTEVFPNENEIALPGQPGQLADGSSTRWVNSLGLEYDQMVIKGLIGALMTDQVLNNYLSKSVLDEAENIENNNNEVTEEGQPYTTMEHKWDEAYGYVFGLNADPANPNDDLGADEFINKYLGRVEEDPDFEGISDEIFQSFKLGRAAIVAKNYTIRDTQAELIKEKLSELIAIRAVYYLQQAKIAFPTDRTNYNLYGGALHDLSEGYGFIYSLQFTRIPGTNEPYFSNAEVNLLIDQLLGDGVNGLWDVKNETLDEISNSITAKFDFTVGQAGSL